MEKLLHHWKTIFWLSLLILILLGVFTGCEKITQAAGNQPPRTRLANIPPPDTVITTPNPRLTLYWVGDDGDGFVVAYKYRWDFRMSAHDTFQQKPWTTILNIGTPKSGAENFAFIIDGDEHQAPDVYHYFATLPPEGLNHDSANSLARGDTLHINGIAVWAANSDSLIPPGQTVRQGRRFPVHVNPNSGTFIFDSQDSLNPHTFEVSAIDNSGQADPNPAKVTFVTPRVPPPYVIIDQGPPDTGIVVDHFTDSFVGIYFHYQGFDPNSRTIDYQWVVDRDVWKNDYGYIPWSKWTPNQYAYINASNFPPDSIYATKHTFYVRARNEFGSVDTLGYFWEHPPRDTTRYKVFENRDFFTQYPEFAKAGALKRTLFINNSWDYDTAATKIYPSRQMLNGYYKTMFEDSLRQAGRFDIQNVFDDNVHFPPHVYFPGRGVMSKYSLVVLCCDVVTGQNFYTGHILTSSRCGIFFSYVAVGGKVIITAWDFPNPLNFTNPTEPVSGLDFMRYICHMQANQRDQSAIPNDCIGLIGDVTKGYPAYASFDVTKQDTAWHGAMPYFFWGKPYGFGEVLYRYDAVSPNRQQLSNPQGSAMAIRYIGVTYSVIYFGFPLYYIEFPTAVAIMRRAVQDLSEF